MTHKELKQSILDDILSDDFMILQYSDYNFIANQYADAIANNKDLEIQYVDSLDDVIDYQNSYAEYCPFLFIIHADSFDELKDDYSIYTNTIVICNKITAKVAKAAASYIIKLDKLDPKNPIYVKEYINEICPGINPDMISKLCYVTQSNIHQISNILDQLKLLPVEKQNQALVDLMNIPGTELYFETAFTLVDALTDMNNQLPVIKDILLHRNCCDITAMFILTLLNTKLRNKAIICCGGKVSNKSFRGKDGKTMSPEYFRRIQNSFYYNPKSPASVKQFEKLRHNLEFLSSIDQKIKLGQLELSDSYLLDYIITHIR